MATLSHCETPTQPILERHDAASFRPVQLCKKSTFPLRQSKPQSRNQPETAEMNPPSRLHSVSTKRPPRWLLHRWKSFSKTLPRILFCHLAVSAELARSFPGCTLTPPLQISTAFHASAFQNPIPMGSSKLVRIRARDSGGFYGPMAIPPPDFATPSCSVRPCESHTAAGCSVQCA